MKNLNGFVIEVLSIINISTTLSSAPELHSKLGSTYSTKTDKNLQVNRKLWYYQAKKLGLGILLCDSSIIQDFKIPKYGIGHFKRMIQ